MAFSSGNKGPMAEINVTPLIDVMLVLLIMLIITIPLQTHTVSMNLPQGDPPPPTTTEEPKVVNVVIDFDNSISWNGEPITSEDDLQARFRAAAAEGDQPEMHINPNRLADYKTVAHVLADAQRLGITKLGIVGQDQFMNDQ